MPTRCLHIHLTLKNKGVASRFLVMQQAYRYGVRGSVQRKDPETYFIIAEGEDPALEQFLTWCRTFQLNFPDCVTFEEHEVQNYTSFDIIRNRENIG